MSEPGTKVGDWVRYRSDRGLVIGVVQYVREARHYPWGIELVLDTATIREDSVIERRDAP